MSRQFSIGKNQSPVFALVGVVVAAVAVLGTRVLGWEWGSGQLLPTMIGVAVAAFAVVGVAGRQFGLFE